MPSQTFHKEGYSIAESDEVGDPSYYLSIDENGNWYILQITGSSYRYYRGSNNTSYTDAWTNRASLSYDYPDKIF